MDTSTYMQANSPLVSAKIPVLGGKPLLTRTVFVSQSERDLFTTIDVQVLQRNKMALIVIGTSESKENAHIT